MIKKTLLSDNIDDVEFDLLRSEERPHLPDNLPDLGRIMTTTKFPFISIVLF